MEELHFSSKQVIVMITDYYKKKKQKNVEVEFSCGKVVSEAKYIPKTRTINFGVYELLWRGEKKAKIPLPVDIDDMKRIVSDFLGAAGFRAEDISLEFESNSIGICVKGERVKTKENTI